MDFTSMLDKRNFVFNCGIQTKKELFTCLAETLERNGYLTNKKRFIKDLEKREKESSTGIEDGIGIPHAKSKVVKQPVIAFAHTSGLNDYHALDGSLVECVFMIAVPEKANDLHLDTLSFLARKLMNEQIRSELKKAKNGEELQLILTNLGG
ncbi:fructose PTS transporter subunit IIA [Terribacillus sp. 179-K 1B1 HS]|uniref:PTS sugar transporter subunit IIA n=1 Tax=Terribacillus sp. 179-K 1B1 HS TaxID=3142388 RepID=UPI0039A28C9E